MEIMRKFVVIQGKVCGNFTESLKNTCKNYGKFCGNLEKILQKFLGNFEKWTWKVVYATFYKFREMGVEKLQTF